MSLPQFPNPEDILNREEALTAIITSIAMEEQALAHIIEAESAKICYAVKHAKSSCSDDMQNLLKVNNSAANLLERISDMQLVLKNKLRIAVDALPKPPCPPVPPKPPCPPKPPPKPPCPPRPPCPKCTSVFAAGKCLWAPGKTLHLDQRRHCGDGVKLERNQCGSRIVLPSSKAYEVEIGLKFCNNSGCPVEICLEQEIGGELSTKSYKFCGKKQEIKLCDTLVLEGTKKHNGLLSLHLISQNCLEISKGNISVTGVERCSCAG